jgi:hypothetical protein
VLKQLEGGVDLRQQPLACRVHVAGLEGKTSRQSVADSEYRVDGPL